MSAVIDEDRVTFAEQLGCAMNASDLTVRETRGKVDDLIGLGMALADMQRNPGKHPVLEEVERELVPVMWRMKAGEQHAYQQHGVILFAEWMIRKGRFSEAEREQCQTFSGRIIHEWLHESCKRCGGSGVLERAGQRLIRPVGNWARNPKFTGCELCHGSRRALPRHGERAKTLGITMRLYDAHGWERKFNLALSTMDRMMGRLNRRLAIRFRGA